MLLAAMFVFCIYCFLAQVSTPERGWVFLWVRKKLAFLQVISLFSIKSLWALASNVLQGWSQAKLQNPVSAPRTSPCLPCPSVCVQYVYPLLVFVKFPSHQLKERIQIIMCMTTCLHFVNFALTSENPAWESQWRFVTSGSNCCIARFWDQWTRFVRRFAIAFLY